MFSQNLYAYVVTATNGTAVTSLNSQETTDNFL